MKKQFILLNKPVSLTPYQCIQVFRTTHPEYASVKLGFAGRLDPMAEGLLLVLVGEENKKRKEYEALNKTYEFSVLFGIETDSYDILGLPKTIMSKPWTEHDDVSMYRYMETIMGTHQQAFPPFSSKPVKGKPLFKWARERKLNEIDIPTHPITVYSFEKRKSSQITGKQLRDLIRERIEPLQGVFRQEKILSRWDSLLKNYHTYEFPLLDFTISCSSGTYVRTIAHELGKKLKRGAITYTLRRKSIGPYHLVNADRR